jgi:1-acyl-sn-glycerol-3-phosphate acyltransferase
MLSVKHLFQNRLFLNVIKVYLLCRFRFRVEGLQYAKQALNNGGGILLAGNHTGLLDTLLVSVGFPAPLTFLMREDVLAWKGVGPIVKHANILVLWRNAMTKQLRTCIDRLRQGEYFVIFPEGELTKTGQLNPFNDGVGLLWQKGHAVLLPFAIHGGCNAWKEGEWHATGVNVMLEFLPPIEPISPQDGDKSQRATVAEALRQHIQQALDKRTT